MTAALHEQDALCRMFGKCLSAVPSEIDLELGGLTGAAVPGFSPRLFTYVRYNAELTDNGLTSLGLSGIAPSDVQQMDSVAHIDKLSKIGKAVGDRHVSAAHFQGFLP